MTRRTAETFHGFNQPDVLVTIDGTEHRGNLRAWAVDDETGDWGGQCHYVGTGIQMLGWVHQDSLRRDGDLTDHDGLVATKVVPICTVPEQALGDSPT